MLKAKKFLLTGFGLIIFLGTSHFLYIKITHPPTTTVKIENGETITTTYSYDNDLDKLTLTDTLIPLILLSIALIINAFLFLREKKSKKVLFTLFTFILFLHIWYFFSLLSAYLSISTVIEARNTSLVSDSFGLPPLGKRILQTFFVSLFFTTCFLFVSDAIMLMRRKVDTKKGLLYLFVLVLIGLAIWLALSHNLSGIIYYKILN